MLGSSSWWRRAAFLTALIGPGVAQGEVWSDRTRDIYIDGELDRGAQFFSAEPTSEVAILADAFPRVIVFDPEERRVGWLERTAFVVNDAGTSARSTASREVDAGAIGREIDPVYLITAGAHTVLVAPHQGHAGPIELAELWRTVPVWRRLAAAYEPDAAALAALRAVDRDVFVRVVLGTWCGDSKRYVPELLKTLERAENPRIHLELLSIGRGFQDPLDFVRDERVTNVPTILVSEDGREIGRIVETPAGEKIETDLTAILAGETPLHRGRWDRGRCLARGAYEYTAKSGERRGTEEWEIFSTEEGGRLVHCERRIGDRKTEVWQRLDAEGRPSFVEVTRTGAGETSRSRHWFENGRMRSMTRGNTTGILEQTAELPADWTVLLPTAAGQSLWAAASTYENASHRGATLESSAFHLAGAGSPAAARMTGVELRNLGRQAVETPAGRFEAVHFEQRLGETVSEWWLDARIGVPVLGKTEYWDRIVLTKLDLHPEPETKPLREARVDGGTSLRYDGTIAGLPPEDNDRR